MDNGFYESMGGFTIVAWMLLGFLVMWSFAGVTASATFSGRDREVVAILVALFAVLLAVLCLGLAFPDQMRWIGLGAWMVVGVAVLGLTLWVMQLAWRRKLIGARQIVGGVLLWALLAIGGMHFVEPEMALGVVMLSSVAAFGVVGAPLGLAAGRHL